MNTLSQSKANEALVLAVADDVVPQEGQLSPPGLHMLAPLLLLKSGQAILDQRLCSAPAVLSENLNAPEWT